MRLKGGMSCGMWHGIPKGAGVLAYITYTGMCRPTGRFLERGKIFRTHESSSFESSHLKLFQDRLLLKIRFNGLTSKLLYSCGTLCFSMQGGRILGRVHF